MIGNTSRMRRRRSKSPPRGRSESPPPSTLQHIAAATGSAARAAARVGGRFAGAVSDYAGAVSDYAGAATSSVTDAVSGYAGVARAKVTNARNKINIIAERLLDYREVQRIDGSEAIQAYIAKSLGLTTGQCEDMLRQLQPSEDDTWRGTLEDMEKVVRFNVNTISYASGTQIGEHEYLAEKDKLMNELYAELSAEHLADLASKKLEKQQEAAWTNDCLPAETYADNARLTKRIAKIEDTKSTKNTFETYRSVRSAVKQYASQLAAVEQSRNQLRKDHRVQLITPLPRCQKCLMAFDGIIKVRGTMGCTNGCTICGQCYDKWRDRVAQGSSGVLCPVPGCPRGPSTLPVNAGWAPVRLAPGIKL